MSMEWIAGSVFFLFVGLLSWFTMKKYQDILKYQAWLSSFGAGFIIALIFTHMLPEVYHHLGMKGGLWVIGGFVIQTLLEPLSKGIEHGHIHVHKREFPTTIIIGLLLQAFLESLPLFTGHSHHGHEGHEVNHNLVLGILLHKVPITIVLVSLLMRSEVAKGKMVVTLFLFALTMPVGAAVGALLNNAQWFTSDVFIGVINGLVVGILLHISTTIVFEQDQSHSFNLNKFIGIGLGIALALITIL